MKKYILVYVIVVMLMIISVFNINVKNVYGDNNLNEKNEVINPSFKILNNVEQNLQTEVLSSNSFQVSIEITKPENGLYLFDNKILPFTKPIILGPITIKCNVNSSNTTPVKVEFLIDGELKRAVYSEPYEWTWDETAFFSHSIEVRASSDSFSLTSDKIDVICFNLATPQELSKDEAIDILLKDVIKPESLDHILYAFTLNDTLKEGDKTSPWISHPTPVTVQKAPYPMYRTTNENEWFFYIDDSPRAMFCHSVRYVFINAKTAEIEVNQHYWWPILNDGVVFCSDNDYWDPDNWAYTNDEEPAPEFNITECKTLNKEKMTTFTYNTNNNGESAIIINGNNGSQTCSNSMKTSSQQMAGFFLQQVPSVQQLNPENNNNSQSDIEDAFNNTNGDEDCVVYITGHGGKLSDGEPYISCGDDLVCEYELCKMQAKNPDTEYKYVIDSCFSGGFIESLKNESNTRKVICSSRTDEPSWSDTDRAIPPTNIPDPNPKDEGMEFSSGFIEDLWKITWDNPDIGMVELLDEAYISACEKDVNALNGRTHPQLWERIDDPTSPNVEITSPPDGAHVTSPVNVHGHASDFGGSGVAELGGKLEWEGGAFDDIPVIDIDPPSEYVEFHLGPINLEYFIMPGDWLTVTIYAIDDMDNEGSDSITVIWEEEAEDTTPPVTEKTVGQPNQEDGYIIWPFTPIWLEATDPEPGSGVQYIYYEIAWDNNGDGVWDDVFEETVYQDAVEIIMINYGILYGKIELRWYAVDNANNKELMNYQQHVITE